MSCITGGLRRPDLMGGGPHRSTQGDASYSRAREKRQNSYESRGPGGHRALSNYTEARQWLLKAQAVQRKSGRVWLPALDQEVERIKQLAAGQ